MHWWRRLKRKRECRRKYGNACPHVERHARKWTHPAPGATHRALSSAVVNLGDRREGASSGR